MSITSRQPHHAPESQGVPTATSSPPEQTMVHQPDLPTTFFPEEIGESMPLDVYRRYWHLEANLGSSPRKNHILLVHGAARAGPRLPSLWVSYWDAREEDTAAGEMGPRRGWYVLVGVLISVLGVLGWPPR
jgi:hypothetical protein